MWAASGSESLQGHKEEGLTGPGDMGEFLLAGRRHLAGPRVPLTDTEFQIFVNSQ
jgi:hypothetical protein